MNHPTHSHAPTSPTEKTPTSCCSGHPGSAPTTGALDPVCGMTVDLNTTLHRAEYEGRAYYFCSARCREKFQAEPMRYLGGKESVEPRAGRHALYLSHAPGSTADWSRRMPEMWHGT